MLPQEHMIERVRTLCREDARLDAAMMYGSFTRGEGDACSDIEFLLFFTEDAFPGVDQRTWLEQIAPVEHLYVNDFGITAVIFDNLIRGEFHFHSIAQRDITQGWPGAISFPSLESTLIVDKSGQLTPCLEPIIGPPVARDDLPQVQFVADGFINWALFGLTVLRRGERIRALELLNILHRHLLQLVRLHEDSTANWLTPSKSAEQDLSPEVYARFEACVARGIDAEAMGRAYRAAWEWGNALLDDLRARHAITLPDALRQRITDQFFS